MKVTPWRVVLVMYLVAHFLAAFWTEPLLVAEVAIAEAALFAWVFVIGYARLEWWVSAAGVQFMSLGLFVALLTSLSLIPPELGFDGDLREWVAAVVMSGMAALALNLVRLLFHYNPWGELEDEGEQR